jgi:hypothetical protein
MARALGALRLAAGLTLAGAGAGQAGEFFTLTGHGGRILPASFDNSVASGRRARRAGSTGTSR